MRFGRVALWHCTWAMMCGAGSVACTTILGLDAKPLGVDSGEPRVDAGVDAGPACKPVDGGYHDLTSKACWSVYAISTELDPYATYSGGSFDGRYLYFLSGQTGDVIRYDPQLPFSKDSSWAAFSTTTLQNNNNDFYAGVVFDGTYMYFIPGSGEAAYFIRYDTTKEFSASSSWSSFAVAPSDPLSYQGGTFDGRYVYFAPESDGNLNNSGLIERYDTTQEFTSAGSWSSFDTSTLPGAIGANASAYNGALFDGRYVYFMPSALQANVIARFDTHAPFTSAASWSLFDTGTVNEDVEGFPVGMFDGKYVYLVPGYASEVALQYDIALPFTETSSWKQHIPDPTAGAVGSSNTPVFTTGGFDGRSFYYVPSALAGGFANGLLVRHVDLDGGFTDAGWSSFDTANIGANAFGATVFDGRYLYLAPDTYGGVFARFEARDTAFQPKLPEYFGSFY